MSALEILIDPLKRSLAVPGEFDTYFPDTGDDDLLGSLGDAFSEAQLDGFFGTMVLDLNDFTVTPDLSQPGGALVVIYAAGRIIRARIRSLNSQEKYSAGPVSYEVARAASTLKAELDDITATKLRMLEQARRGAVSDAVFDGYFSRAAVDWQSIMDISAPGFYAYELAG